jgi:hypothetical protein
VGPGGIEPPTSPLSGVRSSHLSYGPKASSTGGAGRDRTGDLLNANQALSQLSYSPKINRGQLDAETMSQAHGLSESLPIPKWRSETGSSDLLQPDGLEWNGCLLLATAVHFAELAFRDSTHVLS